MLYAGGSDDEDAAGDVVASDEEATSGAIAPPPPHESEGVGLNVFGFEKGEPVEKENGEPGDPPNSGMAHEPLERAGCLAKHAVTSKATCLRTKFDHAGMPHGSGGGRHGQPLASRTAATEPTRTHTD